MKSLPIVLVVAVVSNADAASAPSMTVSWASMTLSDEDCTALGEKTMRATGLTKNFEIVGTTVYGETGDYTAAIRCVSSKEIVFFVTAGPKSDRTEEINKNNKALFIEPKSN